MPHFYRLLLVFLLLSTGAYAQHSVRYAGDYTIFTLPFEGDSIRFVVVARPGDLSRKKPVFLFRQGSLPIPLLARKGAGPPALTEFPTAFGAYRNDYHGVVISKPGIPLEVDDSYLDSLFAPQAARKPALFPPTYRKNNYLDYYVRQTRAVLDFILKQPWADASKVVLAGGSEGYHVAIKTAATTAQVTHLIAFSGNLEGRFQSIVRTERAKALSGQYTHEEAQRRVEALQQEWAAICADSLSTEKGEGDPYRTTYSFSTGENLAHLLSLTIPICILYGTADVGALSNDILPMEFARRGRNNLTLKAYPGHDHSFFKLLTDAGGKVVDKVYNGEEVQRYYFEWLKTH